MDRGVKLAVEAQVPASRTPSAIEGANVRPVSPFLASVVETTHGAGGTPPPMLRVNEGQGRVVVLLDAGSNRALSSIGRGNDRKFRIKKVGTAHADGVGEDGQ